jgi:hypothetical protein
MKLEFSGQIFFLNAQISTFMKIRPVGTEYFHATDRHNKANSRFTQFCERALKKTKQNKQ